MGFKQSVHFKSVQSNEAKGHQNEFERVEGCWENNTMIDPSKRNENIEFRWSDIETAYQKIQSVKDKIKGGYQKTSKHFTSAIFSLGNMEKQPSKEICKKYLEESIEWVKKMFGVESLVSGSMHFDESTPHLHLIFDNLVQMDDGSYKVSFNQKLAKALGQKFELGSKMVEDKKTGKVKKVKTKSVNSKLMLSDVQQLFWEEVSKKYGAKQPEKNNSKHKKLNEFKQSKEFEKLEIEVQKLNEFGSKLSKVAKIQNENEGLLLQKEVELQSRENKIIEIESQKLEELNSVERLYDNLFAWYKDNEMKMSDVEKRAYKQSLEVAKTKIDEVKKEVNGFEFGK